MMSTSLFRGGAVALTVVCVSAAFAAAPRVEQTINRDWTFQYFPAETPDLAPVALGFDDSRWPAVSLPHTWSTYETTGDRHLFIRSAAEKDDSYWWYGWGWYRKHVTIGREFAGRRIALEFDGVQKFSRVYVNGQLVGEHKGGYNSFSFDITPHVRFGQDNVIVVQVNNRQKDLFGTIPPATAGNFDVYGGVYRDVRLMITDRLHVPFQGSADHEGGTFVTTPEVSATRGTVRVRTWVKNDYGEPRATTLVTTVRDAAGQTVLAATARETIAPGAIHEFDQALGTVDQPHLWAPETPYLYTVSSEVRDGDRPADTYASPLGFRWFSWDFADNRLILNGQKIVLRGINRHQEFPWLGDAMPKWLHRRDLEDIRRGMGLYFQRTVHYPNDPFVYAECDRLGFLLIEEAPNIKDIAFGRDIQQQNMLEMVRRDRNHPSILIWSMGNETNQPADSAWAHAEDTSRLIYMRRCEAGEAFAGKFIQMTDKNLSIENLLRCTVRGWLNTDDHDFGAPTGQPDGSQVTGTEEWQHFKNRSSDRLLTNNIVTWLYADHGCDREYLNSPLLHINPKGWVDAYRFPKLTYYLWQANFTTKPMAFIHPTFWRLRYLGQKQDIRVDSNCDEIELKLDGRSLGVARPTDANLHSVVFPGVTVTRGTLAVEGRKDTTRVAARLAMADEPARLVLTTTHDTLVADRAGLAVVSADIVDAAGVHVYGANPPLTWTIAGAGKLVGPDRYTTDTASNGSMVGTMYIDAPVANVVRSTATPGEMRVTVRAPGLAPDSVVIRTVAPAADGVPGLVEPALTDTGRRPVQRDLAFRTAVFEQKAQYIEELRKDADFTPDSSASYREQVERFVRDRNHGVDVFGADFRAFVESMVKITTDRAGHLVADDFNFAVRALNEKLGKPAEDKVKAAQDKAKAKADKTKNNKTQSQSP